MIILVHSPETKSSIAANIGTKDYSYFFVLEKYRKVLSTFATVVDVRDPAREVDPIYHRCLTRGEPCLFLSFVPPFKTEMEIQCPTVSVFAWEYATIPTDVWGDDPRNDWRYVFGRHGSAITHSTFAVQAVKDAMGEDFPVWSIPAPVWDDYTKLRSKNGNPARSRGFDLSFQGVLLDFRGCPAPGAAGEGRAEFIEQRSSDQGGTNVNVRLEGVIYTTVFNPNDGRKNWMDLVWGFCWAFRDVEEATLVMKLAYHDYEAIRNMVIGEIRKLAPFKCRVVALHGYLSDEDYAQLVRESTYVVNSAHGEGQCLPLMEYMSAGKPAVAPAHTAMADYIHEGNAFVVASSREWIHWPHDPRAALRTFRYRIDWESLYHAYLESYRVAVSDPRKYRAMSEGAVESLKKYCSRAVVKKRLKDVLAERGVKREGMMVFVFRKLRWMLLHDLPLWKDRCIVRLGQFPGWVRKVRQTVWFWGVLILRKIYVHLKKVVS